MSFNRVFVLTGSKLAIVVEMAIDSCTGFNDVYLKYYTVCKYNMFSRIEADLFSIF